MNPSLIENFNVVKSKVQNNHNIDLFKLANEGYEAGEDQNSWIKNEIEVNLNHISEVERRRIESEFFDLGPLTTLINDKSIQEIIINAHKFTGITALTSVEDYKNGRIKKHENTLESRETIFKNYLKTTRFNAEPVLLTYKNSAALSELIKDVKKHPETSVLKFSENETLKLWQVTNKELIDQIIKGFENIDALYIADGHHRSASSVMLSEEEPKKAETNYFMAFLIPEHELIVQEYNRVVTDLNGLSVSSFLKKIKLNFDSTPHKTYAGSKKGKGFCMYLDGHFYSLSLRKEFVKLQAPLHQLDSYVLQEYILKPILGIENVRTDSRLQYAHKSDQMKWIKKQIDNKTYAVGFGLNPLLIDQLKAIADNNLVMPPKSTYIYPKLRSGTTIYEF